MPTRKTGTVTGASLERAPRARKGGLTGSKRVTGESDTPIADTSSETVLDTPTESTAQPTPTANTESTSTSIGDKIGDIVENVAGGIEAGAKVAATLQGYTSRIASAIQKTDMDSSVSALTDGKVNTSEIMARASVDIDENVGQLDSAEAIKRNIIISRQRNFVGVAINNTQLKQDIQKLNNEQQKLIGLIIDGKKFEVDNETKAVQFHRATTKRDTELSALEEDRELQLHQQIRTEGTQAQTPLILQKEQLKVVKLKEEIEKMGHEINNIVYEKEKVRNETEARFSAGF